MACRLTDIIRRRVPVMLLARPDRGAVEDAAALAAPILGWNEERQKAEAAFALEVWKGAPEGMEDLP